MSSSATVYNLTDSQLETLWHSLGMTSKNYRRKLEWWLSIDRPRNHFCTETANPEPGVLVLTSLGLMKDSLRINRGWDTVYIVTSKGIRVAREAFFEKMARTKGNPTMSKRKQSAEPSMFGQGVGAYGQATEKPAAKVVEPVATIAVPVQDINDMIALIDEGFELDARAMLANALKAAGRPTGERTEHDRPR